MITPGLCVCCIKRILPAYKIFESEKLIHITNAYKITKDSKIALCSGVITYTKYIYYEPRGSLIVPKTIKQPRKLRYILKN